MFSKSCNESNFAHNFFVNTGCSRKNYTQFKHHNFATVYQRVKPFSAKCSERKSIHDKDQCLNTAKYSLLFSWQVNYSVFENKAVDLAPHNVLLSNDRFWLLEGVSTVKKLFHPRTKYDLPILLWVIRFFKHLHAFNRFSLSAAVRDWTHGVETLWAFELQVILGNSHNWRTWNYSLSRDSRGLLLVPGCPSWLRIKSLTNSMFDSNLSSHQTTTTTTRQSFNSTV